MIILGLGKLPFSMTVSSEGTSLTQLRRRGGRRGRPKSGGRDLSAALGRGSSALYRALSEMSPPALRRLARAPVDEEVLLAAALSSTVLDRFGDTSPLVGAQLRGVDAKLRMLGAEGGSLSPADAGRLLGVTRQAVDKGRRSGRLLAVDVGRRWRYPAWQIVSGRVLAGVPESLAALRTPAPWAKAAFFLRRNARLRGRRPIDVLRRGRLDAVVRAARAQGSHGAA
jgi:hypothetical protein